MALRGTGHGVSTADKVRAIAVDHVRKKYAVKDDLKLEELQFESIFYRVHGHYTDDKGMLHRFSVKLDGDGNVVEDTERSV